MADKDVKEVSIEVVKDKSVGDYKSEDLLDPQKESTKLKYMEIYHDYTVGNKTEKQLAESHGFSPDHVCRIIKWAVHQLDNLDNKSKLHGIVDKLRLRQQTIEAELPNCKTVKEKAFVWGELRKTDRLIAQLEGLLSTAIFDMSDRRSVNMTVSDQIKQNRRTGVS